MTRGTWDIDKTVAQVQETETQAAEGERQCGLSVRLLSGLSRTMLRPPHFQSQDGKSSQGRWVDTNRTETVKECLPTEKGGDRQLKIGG